MIGIRSDFRLGENPAAQINPAVRWFMDKGPYGGAFIWGADAYDEAAKVIRAKADAIRGSEWDNSLYISRLIKKII